MNSIGTRGANALYEAIEVNGTISIVDINCNIVADKKFILKIEELCKKNDKKSPKRTGMIGKKTSPKTASEYVRTYNVLRYSLMTMGKIESQYLKTNILAIQCPVQAITIGSYITKIYC